MVLDGGAGTATALGSAVNISLRLFQVIYELKAVGQQTQDLLDSTEHVSATLQSARTLRRQKSPFLSADEKKWIDNVLIDSERCLQNVAALVEPARVDLQTKAGRVGLINRGLFVFRDSPKVGTNLSRLNLTHQSLNAVMGVLCSKGAQWQAVKSQERWQLTAELQTSQSDEQEIQPPPSYEKDQFLRRRQFSRASNRSRMNEDQNPRPVCLSDDREMRDGPNPLSLHRPQQSDAFVAELEAPDGRLIAAFDKSTPDGTALRLHPAITPLLVPPACAFDESEGLQVVEQPPQSSLNDQHQPPVRAADSSQQDTHDRYQGFLQRDTYRFHQLPVNDNPKFRTLSSKPSNYSFSSTDESELRTNRSLISPPQSSMPIPFTRSDAYSRVDFQDHESKTSAMNEILDKTSAISLPLRKKSRGRVWLELRGTEKP